MRWLLVVCAASLWLGAANTSASAAPFTPRLELGYILAIEYWGREPLQCASVDKEVVPAAALEEGDIGFATVPAPGESGLACEIRISETLTDRLAWDKSCKVMAHEMGHLLGYGHSPDPTSIMYPVRTEASSTPQCEAAGIAWQQILSIRTARSAAVEFCLALEPTSTCWERARKQRRRTNGRLHAALRRFWAPLRLAASKT